MTQKNNTDTKNNIKTVTMSNGTKLEIDLSKNNGHLLMKCRQAAQGSATVIYLLSEIALFDGEKIPAPELLNWNAFDIIELEEIWADLKEKK